jgi:hypothetical protein
MYSWLRPFGVGFALSASSASHLYTLGPGPAKAEAGSGWVFGHLQDAPEKGFVIQALNIQSQSDRRGRH